MIIVYNDTKNWEIEGERIKEDKKHKNRRGY